MTAIPLQPSVDRDHAARHSRRVSDQVHSVNDYIQTHQSITPTPSIAALQRVETLLSGGGEYSAHVGKFLVPVANIIGDGEQFVPEAEA